MAGPHCLVYEPDVTGHRLQHVRHLCDALFEIGCRVTLALQSDFRGQAEYRVHVAEIEPRLELFPELDPVQDLSLRGRWRRVRELFDTVSAVGPDWVYVPYADGTTQIAALESLLRGNGAFPRVPIEAQVMRGKYGYPSRSLPESIDAKANRFLTRRSPWRVTHVLDPIALKALEPLDSLQSFRLIPEPVEEMPNIDRRAAREALGVPIEGRYLANVGGLHPRKGIDLLLRSFAQADLGPTDRLLLVGKMSTPIPELVNREYGHLVRQQRIVVVDRYVTDFELQCGFLAADLVAASHPRQIGSSGTLVRAAAAKRFVLASDFGWVGWTADAFQLGATVNVSDVAHYSAAISAAFDRSGAFQCSAAADRFCQYHTIPNQKAHWVREISQTLKLTTGTIPKCLPWSWVLEAVATA